MNKIFLTAMAVLLMGCSNDKNWSDLFGSFESVASRSKPATIDTSEFKNGRLRVIGSCGDDGEILLILPATIGDDRIIGSPKCNHGRYEMATSKFGRPPCGVVVEYGGDHRVKAIVNGAEIYCD